MKLEIEEREKEGILILDLEGHLVLGNDDMKLRQRLQALLDAKRNRVVVNVQKASEVDTSGLGTLVAYARRFHEAGGEMVLLDLGGRHARVPETAKLKTLIEIYQDETEAVNSFFPGRTAPHYDILDYVERLERSR